MDAPATGTGLIVRPVCEMDTAAIEAIDERLLGRYRPHHWETRVRYYLSRDPEAALVAELDGEVVGFLFADIRGWEFGLDEPTAWIEVVGVHPDQQHRGIGRRLAEQLLEHCRAQGVRYVRTMVHQDDHAIAGFMRSLGLEPAPWTAYAREL
ncbi:MAG: hypothetical protein KatS3mg102_1699 [Planctomycetota bacterium]|nr:MAG: hypothetical protein KatS3mg102_1699 [Planctomycetota bacterium]